MNITSIMEGLEEGETLTITMTKNRLRVEATATKMGTTISAACPDTVVSASASGDDCEGVSVQSVLNSLRRAGNTKTG